MTQRAVRNQKIAFGIMWLAAGATLAVLLAIIGYVFVRGMSAISWEFLTTPPTGGVSAGGGVSTAIVGTLFLTLLAVVIASPIGVGAAIYLTEYAKGGRLIEIIRFGTETLAGIPSVVFGLFGYIFFVIVLRPVTGGFTILSASLTLSVMILPTIIRTSEEAIKAVPQAYRAGSFALGASPWQTIRRAVLPAAIPGIATGVILGMGRALGETIIVLLTAGGSMLMPQSVYHPTRNLSVHLYVLATETKAMDKAFATGIVLMVGILSLNLIMTKLMHRFAAKN